MYEALYFLNNVNGCVPLKLRFTLWQMEWKVGCDSVQHKNVLGHPDCYLTKKRPIASSVYFCQEGLVEKKMTSALLITFTVQVISSDAYNMDSHQHMWPYVLPRQNSSCGVAAKLLSPVWFTAFTYLFKAFVSSYTMKFFFFYLFLFGIQEYMALV